MTYRALVRQSLYCAFLLSFIAGCAPQPANDSRGDNASLNAGSAPPTRTVPALAAEHAQQILHLSPEFATQLGVSETVAGSGFQARLSDYSPAANEAVVGAVQQLLADVESIDRKQLSQADATTLDALQFSYRMAVAQNRFDVGLPSVLSANPPYAINQLFGPQIDLPRLLIAQHPLRSAADVADWMKRLAELPSVLDALVRITENDARKGVVPPYFALQAVAKSARQFSAADPAEHPIATSFADRINQLGDLTLNQR